MKIAIVCYPGYGGSGVVATELAIALAEHGEEVHVLSTDAPPRLTNGDSGVTFDRVTAPEYPLFASAPLTLAFANRMVALARQDGPLLVHVHYAVPHATSALLARDLAAPSPLKVITTLHGTDVTLIGSHPAYYETTRDAIARSDAVTAVSSALREEALARFGIEREIEVIPNFVRPSRFQRTREIPHQAEPVLIHISNFRPVKRPLDVIEVFHRVNQQRHCRLLLVGDGPELSAVRARCRELGLDGRVTFTGNVDHVEDHLSDADVFLLPSEQESFGLAALEAQASGLPVIATRVGGLPEVIADGETGLLFEPGDHDAMAAGTLRLLGDARLYRSFSHLATDRARSHFGRRDIARRYRNLYARVLAPAKVG